MVSRVKTEMPCCYTKHQTSREMVLKQCCRASEEGDRRFEHEADGSREQSVRPTERKGEGSVSGNEMLATRAVKSDERQ